MYSFCALKSWGSPQRSDSYKQLRKTVSLQEFLETKMTVVFLVSGEYSTNICQLGRNATPFRCRCSCLLGVNFCSNWLIKSVWKVITGVDIVCFLVLSSNYATEREHMRIGFQINILQLLHHLFCRLHILEHLPDYNPYDCLKCHSWNEQFSLQLLETFT